MYARAGAMRIDFSAAAAANASLDPMDGMHREEEDRRRREALPVRDDLLVVDIAAGLKEVIFIQCAGVAVGKNDCPPFFCGLFFFVI